MAQLQPECMQTVGLGSIITAWSLLGTLSACFQPTKKQRQKQCYFIFTLFRVLFAKICRFRSQGFSIVKAKHLKGRVIDLIGFCQLTADLYAKLSRKIQENCKRVSTISEVTEGTNSDHSIS